MSPDIFVFQTKQNGWAITKKFQNGNSLKVIFITEISQKTLILNQIYMYKWYQEKCTELGRTFARYNGVAPTIVTIDPEFIKEVTVKQFHNFPDTFDFDVTDDQMTLDLAP